METRVRPKNALFSIFAKAVFSSTTLDDSRCVDLSLSYDLDEREGLFEMATTSRIAVLSIIVEKDGAREEINRILQDYSRHIVGRLGVPYRKREISVIVVIVDAPNDVISALSGKLGLLAGVSAKAVFSKKEFPALE